MLTRLLKRTMSHSKLLLPLTRSCVDPKLEWMAVAVAISGAAVSPVPADLKYQSCWYGELLSKLLCRGGLKMFANGAVSGGAGWQSQDDCGFRTAGRKYP